MKLTGDNRSTRGKTCPSATLSTTNPTWTNPGSNPGLRGERPATNRLSHGTAFPSVPTTANISFRDAVLLHEVHNDEIVSLRMTVVQSTKVAKDPKVFSIPERNVHKNFNLGSQQSKIMYT
jgi:hypothetical protein